MFELATSEIAEFNAEDQEFVAFFVDPITENFSRLRTNVFYPLPLHLEYSLVQNFENLTPPTDPYPVLVACQGITSHDLQDLLGSCIGR